MNETPAPAFVKQTWRKPPRLYEEVARDIAEAIGQGRYAPGEFLPTEQVMVTEYGASRNAIREALKMLSARGMIEVLHGRGSRVLPRHQWQLMDQLVHLMREDSRVPHDLLELRRLLEVEMAGLAAERASAEQIAAMQATIDRMRADADQPEACIDHDIAFHRLLGEATGNVLLPLVLEPVGQLLRASRLATIHNPGTIDRSIAAHEEILRCVAVHESARARQAMGRHLIQVEDEVRQIKSEVEKDTPTMVLPHR